MGRDMSLLPKRQLETVRLFCEGLTKPKIAKKMNCSVHTVNFVIDKIYYQFDVHTRQELTRLALSKGWLDTCPCCHKNASLE